MLDGSVAKNQIAGFKVAADGTLSPLPNSTRELSSPIAVPGDIEFSPDAAYLIATQKVASTIGFTIDVSRLARMDARAKLCQTTRLGRAPFQRRSISQVDSSLLSPDCPFSIMRAYDLTKLNSRASVLSTVSGSVKNHQTDGCWIVITEGQKFAFTANFVSGTISSYRIMSGGKIVLQKGVAAPEGDKSNPTDLASATDLARRHCADLAPR